MRGRCTGTLADVLTDLICKAVPLTLADSSMAYVHEGMAVAAEAIAEQTVDTLAQLFFPQGYKQTRCQNRKTQRNL